MPRWLRLLVLLSVCCLHHSFDVLNVVLPPCPPLLASLTDCLTLSALDPQADTGW